MDFLLLFNRVMLKVSPHVSSHSDRSRAGTGLPVKAVGLDGIWEVVVLADGPVTATIIVAFNEGL